MVWLKKLQLKYLFILEIGVNVVTSILCLFFPKFFLANIMTPIANFSEGWLNFTQWYGILLFVITYIMIRFLIIQDFRGFRIVMEAYFVGDILQMIIGVRLILLLNTISIGIFITLTFTIILMVGRIFVLWKPHLLGFSDRQQIMEKSH